MRLQRIQCCNQSHLSQVIKIVLMFCTISFLSACATSVTVEGDIPKPLVEKIPLRAKLNLTEEFKTYSYLESDKERALKELDFGNAQTQLFQRVFSNVFILSNDDSPTDLVITPTVLSVQYSAPRETQLNLFEVFLKYRITIEDAQAQKLADWVITGYGKTPTASFKGDETAFNSATNVALRDVGAQLIIGIPLQQSIKDMLQERNQAALKTEVQPTTNAREEDEE